ncbi:MAG: hypothetical protein ACJ760_10135 [Thermoleophilaceae bacterium]
MRVGTIVGVLAAVGAVLAPVAQAGPRLDFKMSFTSHDPGHSTGLDVRFLYKHPGAPKAKPIPVRQEQVTFPAGTRFDFAVVPRCTATDAEFQAKGTDACPASWIGSGHGDTVMTGFPGQGETPLSVNGYLDAPNELKLVSQSEGFPVRFMAHAFTHGRTSTVDIPSTPGGPPDGQSALRRVHNVFPARTRNGHVYTRTPPRCPKSREWTFTGRFTFSDGVVEHEKYKMRCRRAPALRTSR